MMGARVAMARSAAERGVPEEDMIGGMDVVNGSCFVQIMQNLAIVVSIFNSKLRIRPVNCAQNALSYTHSVPGRKSGGG